MLTMGPLVAEFEEELARACGTRHALAVSSGTAALHLAVLALGLEPGDEVIVPAYTFPATANVVALSGLRPVLVDVDPATMNLDPAQIGVGPRTKAIMPVHLFGRPARMEELPELPLIEDAAGALGARRRGAPCGSLGLVGLPELPPAEDRHDRRGRRRDDRRRRDRRLRRDACVTTAGGRSPTPTCPSPGLNYRLSDILCAVGLPQLRRLDELLATRTRLAAGYSERLEGLPVVLPAADDGDVHGWQAYVIQVERRDEVLAALRARASRRRSAPSRFSSSALSRPGRLPRCRARVRATHSRFRSTRASPSPSSTGLPRRSPQR